MKFELIFAFVTLNLAIVAFYDLKTRKIKNIWSVINLIFGITFLLIDKESYAFKLSHFVYPFAFLAITFLLFWMKIMGAGDSKYLTTFFFLIPTKMHEIFLHHLILVTAAIGLLFLVFNIIKRRHDVVNELFLGKIKSIYFKLGTKIPYAPVALAAWIWLGVEQLKK